jgi:hypothetical protein
MTDKVRYELLNKFANEHSLSIGGNIEVVRNPYSTSFKPKEGHDGMKYEDVELLSSIIQGAEHFLFWASRNGIEIKVKNGKRNRSRKSDEQGVRSSK